MYLEVSQIWNFILLKISNVPIDLFISMENKDRVHQY